MGRLRRERELGNGLCTKTTLKNYWTTQIMLLIDDEMLQRQWRYKSLFKDTESRRKFCLLLQVTSWMIIICGILEDA